MKTQVMKCRKKSLPYQEGDWFAVPLLQSDSYGVGLVARAPGNGVILGYFFGTRYRNLPTEENLRVLSRTDAILVARFGDTGLVQGHWPVIARKSLWNQEEWPLPTFGRIFELEEQELAWRVEYSSADLVTEVRETRVKPGQIRQLPEDALWGHLALQEDLTNLLAK